MNRPMVDPRRAGLTAGANPVVPMADSSDVSIDNRRRSEYDRNVTVPSLSRFPPVGVGPNDLRLAKASSKC